MTGDQAGQSAQNIARRTREKAERLQRAAAAWEAGALGEQATARVLSRLDPSVWTTWHDVWWPGRQRANIDHVVVGPPGVHVIDSKNWSGQVIVKDGVLRQNGYSREKEVAGAAEAAIAVLQLVPDVPVQPVLCLVWDDPVEGWVRDVMLCSTGNLDAMVETRPPALTPEQVRATAARLEVALARRLSRSARSSSSRPVAARGRRTSRLRPLVGLLMLALLAGAVSNGLFNAGLHWVGDQISDVVVEDPAADPSERRRDRERRSRPGTQDQDRPTP